MIKTFRQLSAGLGLIGVCMVVLLLSDLDSRIRPGEEARREPGARRRVALVQQNTQTIFDAGVAGIIAGLAESGFHDGKELHLRKFNPMGDANLANAVAKEVTEGGYDLIISVTTPSLQAIANANRVRKVPHLFALVSIPSATGVGISDTDPLGHPPYLTGYGTRLPAEQAFRLLYEINPSVRRVGTVWNQSEPNSEVQIMDARRYCKSVGIELVEANVDNTGGVAEATDAVLSRGVDAFFICGDVTVLPAIESVLGKAARRGIPTFSIFPGDVSKGILFGVGADYFEVGVQTGKLASEILRGRNVATLPVTDYMPAKIILNDQVRSKLSEPNRWDFPDSLRNRANGIIDPKGRLIESPNAAAGTASPAGETRLASGEEEATATTTQP
ncbi:MAG TPA: ABC transporter substrate-binding protein [Chthoniobacteraceae bacterium]|nr:ABC transporter substrate-binding protein [Chthoniobacteraceae bacterium]